MTRLALGFVWLLRLFPLEVISTVGSAIGAVMYWVIAERRNVIRVNLAKCFPQMPAKERENLHYGVELEGPAERPHSLTGALLTPFVRAIRRLAPQRTKS